MGTRIRRVIRCRHHISHWGGDAPVTVTFARMPPVVGCAVGGVTVVVLVCVPLTVGTWTVVA